MVVAVVVDVEIVFVDWDLYSLNTVAVAVVGIVAVGFDVVVDRSEFDYRFGCVVVVAVPDREMVLIKISVVGQI